MPMSIVRSLRFDGGAKKGCATAAFAPPRFSRSSVRKPRKGASM